MAGIYIHIPFCKQACSYCDFHFSTKLANKHEVLASMLSEIASRHNYLEGEKISTIYLGGGTPSLLTRDELLMLFDQISRFHILDEEVEITLEANPDDLDKSKLKQLLATPVNRLSVGVQSFHNVDLKFMNRAHTSSEAMKSIQTAQELGFENISIDLIFGSQTTSDKMWEENIEIFSKLEVQHLSAYSLTVEEKTALAAQIAKGKAEELDEDKNYRQYQMLQTAIHQLGFQHYELSNYAKNESFISKHNTAYWKSSHYLGIGPSAHSYNGSSRQWNVNNNRKYIAALKQGGDYFEREDLSEFDIYNEYLITSLRTKWGIDLDYLKSRFSESLTDHFRTNVQKLNSIDIELNDNQFLVKKENWFQSDAIVRSLMWV